MSESCNTFLLALPFPPPPPTLHRSCTPSAWHCLLSDGAVGEGVSPIMSVIVACSGGWGRGVGEILSPLSFNADTESLTSEAGHCPMAPVTPACGEDFLENVARTV